MVAGRDRLNYSRDKKPYGNEQLLRTTCVVYVRCSFRRRTHACSFSRLLKERKKKGCGLVSCVTQPSTSRTQLKPLCYPVLPAASSLRPLVVRTCKTSRILADFLVGNRSLFFFFFPLYYSTMLSSMIKYKIHFTFQLKTQINVITKHFFISQIRSNQILIFSIFILSQITSKLILTVKFFYLAKKKKDQKKKEKYFESFHKIISGNRYSTDSDASTDRHSEFLRHG